MKEYLEHVEELKNVYTILVGKSQGRRLFGRRRGEVILKWILKGGKNV
jgi:hypothetical protein